MTPVELVGELARLTQDRLVSSERVARLVGRLGVTDGEAQIWCLRELAEIARLIPLKTYSEPDARDLLRQAMQEALDSAIEKEA
jgi:type III secretion system TyeA family effector delivery regulator